MSNKTRLQTNNTNLQALIDKANALPDASVEDVTLQEKTITPTTSQQTVIADSGYDGLSKVTVKGDANLVADNIKSGVSIFGVTGTYAGSGEDLSAELTEQANLIAQQQTLISNLETALENKAGGSGGSFVTQGTFTVIDNGMIEPALNEVVLSTDNLNSSTRNVILIFRQGVLSLTIYRINANESFEYAVSRYSLISKNGIVIDENEITVRVDSSYIYDDMTFIAY